MSLLDPNFDIDITERTLYELIVREVLKDSSVDCSRIGKIYYHNRVKEDNRHEYIMMYNITTGDIRFYHMNMSLLGGWVTVYVKEIDGVTTVVTLEDIFDKLKQITS